MPNLPPVQAINEPGRVQLFVMRIWREELGAGQSEWRGKVQHVTSGEVLHFRGWPALVACLQELLNDRSDQL